MRERDNPFDPGAVQVFTLGGRELGYVPKEYTDEVIYEQCFGEIASMGEVLTPEGVKLGATVAFQPHLPPLVSDPFPIEIAGPRHDVLQLLTPNQRTRLMNWAIQR